MKDKETFKRIILLAICIIFIILIAFNTEKVFEFLLWFGKETKVVLIGVAIAFVINIPTRFFEKILTHTSSKAKAKTKNSKETKIVDERKLKKKEAFKAKTIRIVSVLFTVVIILLLIALLTTFIVPGVVDNVKGIVKNIPSYIESCKEFAYEQKDKWSISDDTVDNVVTYTGNKLSGVGLTLEGIVEGTFNFTAGIASGVINFVLSLILALYMVIDKERLCGGLKKVIYAFVPKHKAEYALKAGDTFNKTFSGFVTGQVTEALILGVLCYIGMIIFKMEYAAVISTCIGIFALVPIFGAFIGAVPGVFLLLMISPMKAIWFIIYVIVLQQLEGNLIYPKVVGNSIGLSGFWVLVALIIGGNIAGIPGIIIGIPSFAAVYILFREKVNSKLKEKEIEESKIE